MRLVKQQGSPARKEHTIAFLMKDRFPDEKEKQIGRCETLVGRGAQKILVAVPFKKAKTFPKRQKKRCFPYENIFSYGKTFASYEQAVAKKGKGWIYL